MSHSHIVRSCVIPDRPVSLACPPPSYSSYPIAFVASRSGIWKINLSDQEWIPASFPSSSNTHAAAGAVAVACSPHHVHPTSTAPAAFIHPPLPLVSFVGRRCSAAERSCVGARRSNHSQQPPPSPSLTSCRPMPPFPSEHPRAAALVRADAAAAGTQPVLAQARGGRRAVELARRQRHRQRRQRRQVATTRN